MEDLHVVGSIVPPELDQMLVVERLEDDLNRPGAFDADLDPREGDAVVLIFSPDRQYAFAYRGSVWQERLWGAPEPENSGGEPLTRGAIQRWGNT